MQLTNTSANNFEQCLKCSICTVYCPVSAVNTAYPGPKQAGPDGERYRLKNPDFYQETLKLCLNCKRCEVACPSGVRIGDIIQQARMNHNTHRPKLRDVMLANTDFVGSMATLVAPITNFTLGLKPVKVVMDAALAIDKHRTFPAYTGTKFETWFKKHAAAGQEAFTKHVSYFHGCYVNYNFPQLGKDFVKVMNAVGYGVRLFCQKCPDSVMAAMLDSVLAAVAVDTTSPVKNVAWTTQDSRDGDRAKLHATLRLIAGVARKHPEARFIVQGTHRPILGDPKIRRESFAHWVPVVIF